ncbi:MAG TPA: T9SS type A sorting domain-containing protein [Candidatus Eisenbacteria bacterium]
MLLLDGEGGVFLAWEQGGHLTESPLVQHYDADRNVVSPWPPSPLWLAYYGHDPVLCSDGAGGLFAATGGLMARHVSVQPDTVVVDWPGGGVAVAPAPGWKDAPGIVSDGAGGAIYAWQDPRSGHQQVYAQRLTASGGVAPGWPDSGLVVCTFPSDAGLYRYDGHRMQRYSSIESDGADGALIAWSDQRADSGDIYVQHLLLDGAPSPGWPVNGLALCTAPGIQMVPGLISDGAGGAFVTWQDRRSGSGWQAYAQHVSSSGAVAWAPDGVSLCAAGGEQMIPRPTPDGANGIIVAWQDTRNGHPSVFATRIAADGSLPCGATASVVSTFADSNTVRIRWRLDGPTTGLATVYCRQVDGPWMAVGTRVPNDAGEVVYADHDAIAGCRYAYALGIRSCGGNEQITGEVWIDIPDGGGFSHLAITDRMVEAEAGRLRLGWKVTAGEGLSVTVSRRDSCTAWTSIGTAPVDETGWVHFEDLGLFEGRVEGYRLVIHACGADHNLGETWSEIPAGRGFIPTQVELVSGAADEHVARLTWRLQSGPPCSARVDRRDSTAVWVIAAEPAIEPDGSIRVEDRGLAPGCRYGYRLALASCGVERFFGPFEIRTRSLPQPRFTLALGGARPNPARSGIRVSFTLESSEAANLELFDAGGRLVSSRAVGSLGPGEHVLVLDDRAFRPGVYLVRLSQAGRSLVARAISVR